MEISFQVGNNYQQNTLICYKSLKKKPCINIYQFKNSHQ